MTQKGKVRERDNKYDTVQPLQEISTDTVAAGIKGPGREQFYCNVCGYATGVVWTLCVSTKNEIAAKLVSMLKLEIKRNMLLTINKDGGTEFKGPINQFLEDEGVESRTIPRYDHSLVQQR